MVRNKISTLQVISHRVSGEQIPNYLLAYENNVLAYQNNFDLV